MTEKINQDTTKNQTIILGREVGITAALRFGYCGGCVAEVQE